MLNDITCIGTYTNNHRQETVMRDFFQFSRNDAFNSNTKAMCRNFTQKKEQNQTPIFLYFLYLFQYLIFLFLLTHTYLHAGQAKSQSVVKRY